MVSLNGIRHSNLPVMLGTEKETQKRNSVETMKALTGVAGTALIATGVVAYRNKEKSLLNKAVEATKTQVGKVTTSLKDKLSGGKLESAFNSTKTFIKENGQKAIDVTKKYVDKVPPSIQKAAVVAAGLVAVAHIFRQGQINGHFAAKKAEDSE